jgi:diguanylate cyclase (GGDEF)-like protein
MGAADGQLVRLTTWLALAVVAVALPLAYYDLGRQYHAGRLEAEADLQGHLISQLISRNPTFWRFESHRIDQVLSRLRVDGHADLLRVIDAEGDVVSEYRRNSGGDLPRPILVRTAPLFDAGRPVAEIQIRRSLRPLLWDTSRMAVAGLVIAAVIFLVLRSLPLRALKRAWGKATYLASHDALTGLPNRVLFQDRLEQAFAQAERNQGALSVLCVDLDHFKDVNDTLGHAAGDRLLQQAAARLEKCLRKSDTLARLGGDEFAIIQGDKPQPEGAASLAQRIVDALAGPFDLEGREVVVGSSVGIALSSTDTPLDPGHMLRHADLALYQAKEEGRGAFRFFEEEMNVQLQARKALEQELRRALAEDQFELHYQPQVELDGGRIIGVEALVRWNHPHRGQVSPADFIPLAEETGLIVPLGEWVLRTACRQAVAWPPLKMAVNLSPAQFRQSDLVDVVARVLEETGLEPRRLELEITEGILLRDTEATVRTLLAIKELGVRVAMDDFGTGYSSLSYLHRFPFDKLKIDRSFIRDLDSGENAAAIVRAIVHLGHSLGMTANAEGVETGAQADFLRTEGCEEVQGYHLSPPLPAAELERLLPTESAASNEQIAAAMHPMTVAPDPIESAHGERIEVAR